MTEFFNVMPPTQALETFFQRWTVAIQSEMVPTAEALGRVTAGPVRSPISLPAFPRSTVDGYAVRAADTVGASEGLPAYLTIVGEVPMGQRATLTVGPGQAAIVHTGGMIPEGADAVVMVERTHRLDERTVEVLRAVAVGENVIQVGEDVQAGEEILPAGHRLRPQDVGGLLGVGITQVAVARRPRVAIIATGDEVVPPDQEPGPGQVRDINSYTAEAMVRRAGGIPRLMGIVPDDFEALLERAQQGLAQADLLVLSAGSSVSVRDMTSEVINRLGAPGVLVHGLSIRPGKPTILALCDGKPVFGLPGNPVSAMVAFELVVTPTLWRLQGTTPPEKRRVKARLMRNLSSVAGREDYVQVRLMEREGQLWADPIFGKSNLIFTLVRADGVVRVPLDATGIPAGEEVEVVLHEGT
ncbi:MAG: molybdopterin molybdenumtransferase MoeA [Chloroflexi bacterium]|nr:MAG: molybdopterin molybdenumtransferase MoeA [Chloroflexota bacterium]